MTQAHEIASRIGQKKLAQRIGVGLTAVNNAVSRGAFPASWYPLVRDACEENGLPCPIEAFNFKSPSADAPASAAGE